MELYCVKIGTKPFGHALVKSKRKMPKEGDTINIRHAHIKNIYSNPWIMVKVKKINSDCVFVSLI